MARITVEKSEIAVLCFRLDDHPHSMNASADDLAVLLRFNIE